MEERSKFNYHIFIKYQSMLTKVLIKCPNSVLPYHLLKDLSSKSTLRYTCYKCIDLTRFFDIKTFPICITDTRVIFKLLHCITFKRLDMFTVTKTLNSAK